MIQVPIMKPDGTHFGHIEIACIEARGRQPDSVNVYQAVIRDEDNGYPYDPPTSGPRTVRVEHRYGDHWTVLLRKVLETHAVTHHH